MVLSDTLLLRLVVPKNSRSTAYASFDGKGRIELRRGDEVRVEAGRYPFPTVVGESGDGEEWFESVRRALRWNTRGVVQGGWGGRLADPILPDSGIRDTSDGFKTPKLGGRGRLAVGDDGVMLEEGDDEEEEEEEWDIDADPIEVGSISTVGLDSGIGGSTVGGAGLGGGVGDSASAQASPTRKVLAAAMSAKEEAVEELALD